MPGDMPAADTWRDELERRFARNREEGLTRGLRPAAGRGVRLTLLDPLAESPAPPQTVLSFASNDYLGLSGDARVVAAAQAALAASGAGATASRLLCGTRPEHVALEEDLARFKGSPTALVFASGYQAALATLVALGDAGSTLVLDRLAHACLLDGAQLSDAPVRTFKHNDAADLRRVLRSEARRAGRAVRRCLVVVESLYSMDGDVAPLTALLAACRAEGAWLLVDEAHATGVLGARGRGALEDLGGGDALPADVLALGTLSKALGSQGGFLCTSWLVRQTILQAGRAFLFSTGLAPAAAAAARAALALVSAEPQRRRALLQRAEDLRKRLRTQGWEVLGGPGPILPLLLGDEARAARAAEKLLALGLWVPAVRFPTVRRGAARLRISLTAGHTPEDVDALCEVLERLKPEL